MNTFCSYFNQNVCRSCDLITLDYSDQLKHKEAKLSAAFGSFQNIQILPSVPSKERHFRNKAKFVVSGATDNPVIGLLKDGDLDQGEDLSACDLHVTQITKSIPVIKEFITLCKLIPYQVSARKGELKGIIIFYSETTNESYIRFIMRSKESIDRIKKHASFLQSKLTHLKCISVNIQSIPHALLEGKEEIFITDTRVINHKSGDIIFSLGPKAFVQTNQLVAEKLYATAAAWVRESGNKKFMELFCGQGAFSFFAEKFIETGLGIEINPEAVIVANETASRIGLSKLSFISADASQVKNQIEKYKPETLLVNPPRRGLDGAVDLLMETRTPHLIYSSCNYETLAEDLNKLGKIYRLKRMQIFDMFPHTSHFETLVELILAD